MHHGRPASVKMQLGDGFRSICAKVQSKIKPSRPRQTTMPQISAPFDFKRHDTTLPGMTLAELALLREKAAATRIGIADPPRPVSSITLHPSLRLPRSRPVSYNTLASDGSMSVMRSDSRSTAMRSDTQSVMRSDSRSVMRTNSRSVYRSDSRRKSVFEH